MKTGTIINADRLLAGINELHAEAARAAVGNQTEWLRSRVAALVDVIALVTAQAQALPAAEGFVQTDTRPKNLLMDTDQWDAMLGRCRNAERVAVVLLREEDTEL